MLESLVLALTTAASAGDAQRGAAIATSRSTGLCVLCHAMPGASPAQAGSLAPDLTGVGARLTRDQLRERIVAPERFNPRTVMPSYGQSQGFNRVAAARRDQALLDAQQIEDVAAWLATLK